MEGTTPPGHTRWHNGTGKHVVTPHDNNVTPTFAPVSVSLTSSDDGAVLAAGGPAGDPAGGLAEGCSGCCHPFPGHLPAAASLPSATMAQLAAGTHRAGEGERVGGGMGVTAGTGWWHLWGDRGDQFVAFGVMVGRERWLLGGTEGTGWWHLGRSQRGQGQGGGTWSDSRDRVVALMGQQGDKVMALGVTAGTGWWH